jgi:hypothetical protein
MEGLVAGCPNGPPVSTGKTERGKLWGLRCCPALALVVRLGAFESEAGLSGAVITSDKVGMGPTDWAGSNCTVTGGLPDCSDRFVLVAATS